MIEEVERILNSEPVKMYPSLEDAKRAILQRNEELAKQICQLFPDRPELRDLLIKEIHEASEEYYSVEHSSGQVSFFEYLATRLSHLALYPDKPDRPEREKITEGLISDDAMNGLCFLIEHDRTPTWLELDRFIRALGYCRPALIPDKGTTCVGLELCCDLEAKIEEAKREERERI